MESLFDKIGGRKFVLTIFILIIGALIDVFGKNGLSQNMVALLVGASTVFGVANAAVSMKHGGQVDLAGASTGDEANVKVDTLTQLVADQDTMLHGLYKERDQQAADMQQLRTELETQAKGLAIATQLIKASMKVNV